MQLASEGSSSDEIHASVIKCVAALSPAPSWNYADIGCGNGSLAGKIEKLFSLNSITAIDGHIYAPIKSKKINFIKMNLEDVKVHELKNYDLITCTEVIEHMENPWLFARSLSSLLTPGGHLILSTPNPESIRSLLCFIARGYHCAFGARNRPAHKLALGVYDLSYLLRESIPTAKLDLEYIPNGLIPGSKTKWTQVMPILKGKRFSDNYIIKITKSAGTKSE